MYMSSTRKSLSTAERVIVGLATLGVACMGYLTYVHFQREGSTLCDLAPGFSCEIVNKSIYAEIFGFPVSLLGLAYFVAVILVTVGRIRNGARAIELFTLGAIFFSLYLTGVELYLLASICIFCEFSKILMLAILGITYDVSRRAGEKISHRHRLFAAVAGIAGTIAAYFIQR